VHVIASFEHGTELELALAQLEDIGIRREHIFAVPLRTRRKEPQLFDTIRRSDGLSLFDAGAVLGTVCMLFGCIYGFVLTWGPILWGLIGLFAGFAVGLVLDIWISRRRRKGRARSVSDVFVLVRCGREEAARVEEVLWLHQALGLARVDET